MVTTEAVAVGLSSAALFACCFVTGMRRPQAGRLAATVFVSVIAGLTIAMAVGTLVAGEHADPDSIAVPLGATFLVIGLLIAAVAPAVQFGGEVGRWVDAASLGLLGSLVLWATVTEPIEEDTAVGSVVILVIGFGFIASAALLVGGSRLAGGRAGRPSPGP